MSSLDTLISTRRSHFFQNNVNQTFDLLNPVVYQTLSENLKSLRDQITFRCVKTLSAYRKFVANTTSIVGQLILPESFKLFPLYALALIKSKAFSIGSNLSTDERNFHMKLILKMNVGACMGYFYPRMLALHSLTELCGYKNSTGRISLPSKIRLSCECLEDAGIYLIGHCFELSPYIRKWSCHDVMDRNPSQQ